MFIWAKNFIEIENIFQSKAICYLSRNLSLLPNNFNTQIACKGKKCNSCFKIKDTLNFEHKNDLAYHEKCSANNLRTITLVKQISPFQKG